MTRLLFIVVYLVVVMLIVAGMTSLRRAALAQFGSAAALEDWQAWKQAASDQSGTTGPVQRRVTRSNEPPALILMRDYFAVCLGFAVLLTTLLYGTLALMVYGAWRLPHPVDPDADADG